jgi:ribosomal protein S18 acetylase RimI-like enzyme
MQTPLSSSQSITVNLDSSNTISTEQLHVLPDSNTSISFRFLRPGDQSEVKSLCSDWFPIEYPDKWYDDIAHDSKYFALAACEIYTQRIVGLVVADIIPLGNCNREDQQILHKSFSLTTPVCYILILGVVKEYRRQGLAGILLQELLNTLYKRATCKAVYLHVLYSNKQAIQFYESKNFQYRIHLPYYYCIKGENFDAYCFALYINGKHLKFFFFLLLHIFLVYLGGYPPFTLSDYFSSWWTYLSGTTPCRFLDTFRHFVANKLIYTDYHQRTSSYKQISRII